MVNTDKNDFKSNCLTAAKYLAAFNLVVVDVLAIASLDLSTLE
tara:strand:+ start:57 stop:185 length:129 start_codon:yes stop_codon:yes gene_type:complete